MEKDDLPSTPRVRLHKIRPYAERSQMDPFGGSLSFLALILWPPGEYPASILYEISTYGRC